MKSLRLVDVLSTLMLSTGVAGLVLATVVAFESRAYAGGAPCCPNVPACAITLIPGGGQLCTTGGAFCGNKPPACGCTSIAGIDSLGRCVCQ